MQRRQFIVASVTGVVSSTAGCISLDPGSGGPVHPFADSTVAVRIDNNSETDHDVEANAREALEFWEENSQEYVGFGIEFEVVSADDPEMVIAYADDPSGCEAVEGFSERVLGCAPVLQPGSRPNLPVTARVVAGARPFGKILVTTKHEIGHVLGLGHDDDPREIMSNQPEDRIPLYDVRIEIWDSVLDAHERTTAAIRMFNHAVSQWQEGSYEAASAAFRAARDDYLEIIQSFEDAVARTDEFDGHPRVETVALDDLRELLGQLEARADAAVGFTDAMAEESDARGTGDTDLANSKRADANEYIREYNAIGPVELRDVAIALGLVRGFERDEPVLGEEEDELEQD